jgi:hypothetical protein
MMFFQYFKYHYLKYNLEICGYIYLFVREKLENVYTDLHRTCHIYSLTPEREHRRTKAPESLVGSVCGEDRDCSLQTN